MCLQKVLIVRRNLCEREKLVYRYGNLCERKKQDAKSINLCERIKLLLGPVDNMQSGGVENYAIDA